MGSTSVISSYYCGSTYVLRNHSELRGEAKYYVYILLDLRKPGKYCYESLSFSLLYEPFYVGKGQDYRYTAHFSPSTLQSKSHKNNLIKNLLRSYSRHDIHIKINKNLYEVEAYFVEECLITSIGRRDLGEGPLFNITNGGEHLYGLTEAVRKSYGSPKEKHPLWGKGHSEEAKRKVAENRDYKDISANNNGRAKQRVFITPDGHTIWCNGNFDALCLQHGFAPSTVRVWINKGVVPLNNTPTRGYIYPVGWEFRDPKPEDCINDKKQNKCRLENE